MIDGSAYRDPYWCHAAVECLPGILEESLFYFFQAFACGLLFGVLTTKVQIPGSWLTHLPSFAICLQIYKISLDPSTQRVDEELDNIFHHDHLSLTSVEIFHCLFPEALIYYQDLESVIQSELSHIQRYLDIALS
ncbi:hypothetical protein J6590_091765 [Homalodisca vitripennis]|nr:hypothetical protein J6590_091765 [Homalodisca vitripennis]